MIIQEDLLKNKIAINFLLLSSFQIRNGKQFTIKSRESLKCLSKNVLDMNLLE